MNYKTKGLFNLSVMLTFLVFTANISAVELGHHNWTTTYLSIQNNPKPTWDVLNSADALKNYNRTGTTRVGYVYFNPGNFNQTDFSLIRKRFNMAEQYKDKYDYGSYLFNEEMYTPLIYAAWSPKKVGLDFWNIEETATFAGVEVKQLKPWYITKYGEWNQKWWDDVKQKASKDPFSIYKDTDLKEWTGYYTYSLLKAWHEHMKNLGKKSAIVGFIGMNDSGSLDDALKQNYLPGPSLDYVMKNYDLLFTMRTPKIIGNSILNPWTIGTAQSEDDVRQLRERYKYKGKIMHLLTAKMNDGNGTTDENVAYDEFKRVYPYVDIIVCWPYVKMDWNNPQIPYPPILVKFLEKMKEETAPVKNKSRVK